MICDVCLKPLLEKPPEEITFVRFYGWVRHVSHQRTIIDRERDERRYARRLGFSEEDLAKSDLIPHRLSPGIAREVEAGRLRILAHPVCCADLTCIAKLHLVLQEPNGPWMRDVESLSETTGTAIMRVGSP